MSDSLREKLKDKKLVSGPYTPPKQPEQAHDGEDSAGRWEKYPVFALQLIWPGKGKAKSVKTVLYSSISDIILFDQEEDETGTIIIRYATEAGEFEVVIKGSQLDNLHDHIAKSCRVSVRVTGNVRSISQPTPVNRD